MSHRGHWLLVFTLLACGGASDDDEGVRGLSDEELDREIRAEADALNSCNVVGDCQAVTLNCASLFINSDAQRQRLDELLAEHERRSGRLGCPTVCACGVLYCEAGRCVAESGGCMSEPEGGRNVCL